jgi:tetratricopeptide (TPR) repeat protein
VVTREDLKTLSTSRDPSKEARFAEYLTTNPNDAWAHYYYAKYLNNLHWEDQELNRSKDVICEIEKALPGIPATYEAPIRICHDIAGWHYFKIENWSKASASLRKCIEMTDEKNVKSWMYRYLAKSMFNESDKLTGGILGSIIEYLLRSREQEKREKPDSERCVTDSFVHSILSAILYDASSGELEIEAADLSASGVMGILKKLGVADELADDLCRLFSPEKEPIKEKTEKEAEKTVKEPVKSIKRDDFDSKWDSFLGVLAVNCPATVTRLIKASETDFEARKEQKDLDCTGITLNYQKAVEELLDKLVFKEFRKYMDKEYGGKLPYCDKKSIPDTKLYDYVSRNKSISIGMNLHIAEKINRPDTTYLKLFSEFVKKKEKISRLYSNTDFWKMMEPLSKMKACNEGRHKGIVSFSEMEQVRTIMSGGLKSKECLLYPLIEMVN